MTILTVTQGTPEWKQARLCRVTASKAHCVLAFLKNGTEAADRRDYRLQLVCERLTGESEDSTFVNADMERGTLLEADARRAYEAQTGLVVQTVGFIQHDDLMAGYSPDGLVDDGLLELKVPRSATHLKNIRAGVLPPDYAPQVTHALWLTGAPWCDFCSFDPRFPAHLQLFRVRVKASDLDLAGYEAQVRKFLAEVERDCAALQEM